MKPPICAVCGVALDHGGGLVAFARSVSDADWYERAREPGFVGHPPHVAWLCGAHHAAAKALGEVTLGEALQALRRGT